MLTVEDARIQSASFARRDQAIDTIVLQYTELDLKSSLRIVLYGEDSILKKNWTQAVLEELHLFVPWN